MPMALLFTSLQTVILSSLFLETHMTVWMDFILMVLLISDVALCNQLY